MKGPHSTSAFPKRSQLNGISHYLQTQGPVAIPAYSDRALPGSGSIPALVARQLFFIDDLRVRRIFMAVLHAFCDGFGILGIYHRRVRMTALRRDVLGHLFDVRLGPTG
jgi:hypothetical protein